MYTFPLDPATKALLVFPDTIGEHLCADATSTRIHNACPPVPDSTILLIQLASVLLSHDNQRGLEVVTVSQQGKKTTELQHFEDLGVGITQRNLSTTVLQQLGRFQYNPESCAGYVIGFGEVDHNTVHPAFDPVDQHFLGFRRRIGIQSAARHDNEGALHFAEQCFHYYFLSDF
jgi:hypothetical protein